MMVRTFNSLMIIVLDVATLKSIAPILILRHYKSLDSAKGNNAKEWIIY